LSDVLILDITEADFQRIGEELDVSRLSAADVTGSFLSLEMSMDRRTEYLSHLLSGKDEISELDGFGGYDVSEYVPS
jgi:hypothetical protein